MWMWASDRNVKIQKKSLISFIPLDYYICLHDDDFKIEARGFLVY